MHRRAKILPLNYAKALDAVSIIEMNAQATVIYDREPLDWILFNKMLSIVYLYFNAMTPLKDIGIILRLVRSYNLQLPLFFT